YRTGVPAQPRSPGRTSAPCSDAIRPACSPTATRPGSPYPLVHPFVTATGPRTVRAHLYAAARGDAITDAQGAPVVRPGEPVSRIGGLRAEALVEPGCDEMGSGSSPGAAPTGRKAHEAARFVLFAHGRTRWSDQPNDRSRSSGQPFIEKWPKPDA